MMRNRLPARRGPTFQRSATVTEAGHHLTTANSLRRTPKVLRKLMRKLHLGVD
jgi:hypothetical protein